MNRFLLILLGLMLNVVSAEVADTVEVHSENRTQRVTLRFPQPLVSQTVVENSRQEHEGALTGAELGLDIFSISADTCVMPECRWVDQNRLEFSFPEGSSCAAEYTFQLNPGTRYLGGEAAPAEPVEFRCPADTLEGHSFMDDRGVGVMVYPQNQRTQESRNLSADSKLKFIFRKAHRKLLSGEIYYTGGVPAVAEPAYLKQGIKGRSLWVLAARGRKCWENLQPDSPLPAHLVLRPQKALDPDAEWHLLVQCEEKEGFFSSEAVCSAVDLLPELGAGVFWTGSPEKGYRLEIRFSNPMSLADMPALFERMKFEVAGKVAEKCGQGKKKVTLNNRKIEFRYAGVLELPAVEAASYWWDDEGTGDEKLTYTPQGQVRGFVMEVSATAPELLDVVLPAGTSSYLGFKTQSEYRHRIALNPCLPRLAAGQGIIIPVKGDRSLRIPYANLSAVKVSAWRIAHEMSATAFDNDLSCTDLLAETRLKYAVLNTRDWRGMPVNDNELENLEEKLSRIRKNEKERACRSRLVLENAELLPGCTVSTGESGLVSQGEAVLKLDSATGGPAAPGMYLLRLQQVANAEVRAALQRLGRDAAALDSSQDIVVQVTDLNVTTGSDAVLVNRYSDGSPVEQGTIEFLNGEKAHQLQIENGIAWLPETMEACKAWVRSGEDVVMVRLPSRRAHGKPTGSRSEKASTMLILDRPLYRPGDTVNLRGVLRRVQKDGSCAVPSEKTARVAFCRPDGSEIETRELALSQYGAFESSYTLPTGEDDVTGRYTLRVECGDFKESMTVNCQVFRRDSFKARLTVECSAVAPQEYTVRVQAEDYSGTPLGGAACELRIGDTVEELQLDAAGKAEITRTVTDMQRQNGMIVVSGSVANDREEYVRLEPCTRSIYPADFHISVRNDRMVLLDSCTGKVLEREQKLNLRLINREYKALPGPNGFGVKKEQDVVCWSGELVVPASCEPGVPLPDASAWTPDADEWVITGTDAAGRESLLRHRLWRFRETDSEPYLQVAPEEGMVELRVDLPRAGSAHLFVGHAQQLRHITLPVQAGLHAYPVKLSPGEEGTLSFTLVLPGAQPGEPAVLTCSECFVPVSRYHLEVNLQVPQQDCRPGEVVTLSGQVLAENSPADAEVTLYAVDSGMLSVAHYDCPDPEEFFTRGTPRCFSLSSFSCSHSMRGVPLMFMPAFWRGDLLGCGYSLSPFANDYDTGSSFGLYRKTKKAFKGALYGAITAGSRSVTCAPEPAVFYCMDSEEETEDTLGQDAEPALRSNFSPVAVWKGALRTDADGRFSAEVPLPDTLTTYKVFAVAVDRSGTRFGSAQKKFTVNLPVMLTPGTPLFMSLGDTLRLPLSIVNNTDEPGTWRVTLQGVENPQEITLAARQSGTLYFDFTASAEGEQKLRWMAQGKPGSDAVQGEFSVRFPAPVLKETHRLTLSAGDAPVTLASLLGGEVAAAVRGEMELVASANPLLHLAGAADFLLDYPYGCTEQRASALIPWLLYEHLAPFCSKMAQTRPEDVQNVVKKVVDELLLRQCEDGGLSYWGGWNESSLWATAHAGYVLKLAQEQGYEVPKEAMDKLYRYLWWTSAKDESYRTRFAIARTRGKTGQMKDILREALEKKSVYDWVSRESEASMRFMLSMLENPDGADAAFRCWLRSTGRDYRHGTTQGNAWNLFALVEYLKLKKGQDDAATLTLQDGSLLSLGKDSTTVPLPWQPGQEMKSLLTTLAAEQGTVYATLRLRALPDTTDYPGVTERGLQVTRLYETKGADGIWRPASRFKVGDVVRVTLTCAKVAENLKYLVLEDYMPACMEAINPNVPGQAAGLEPMDWSMWFDYREYLADRVRGFCTRWEGRDLLNMRYYARVKRAGSSMAPPAQAQLMYEPQVYGLSPNCRIVSEP